MPIPDPMMQQPPQGAAPPGPQGSPMPQGGPPQGPQGAQPLPGDDVGEDVSIEDEAARGIQAVGKALYEDNEMSDKLLAMIDEKEKVGSTAQAAIMVVTEMDKQMDVAEPAIASIAVFAADRIMELAEADARQGVKYSDMEAKQVMMTTMEGILMAYGVTPERQAEASSDLSEAERGEHQATYEDTLNG